MRYSFLILFFFSQTVFALDFPDSTNPAIKSMIERFKTDLPKLQSDFFNIPNPAPSWPCEISENEKFSLAGSLSDEQLIKSEKETAEMLREQGLTPSKNKRSNAKVIPIAVQCKNGKVDTEEFDVLLSYDTEDLNESSFLNGKKMTKQTFTTKSHVLTRNIKSKSDPYSPLSYSKFKTSGETHYDDKDMDAVMKDANQLKDNTSITITYEASGAKVQFDLTSLPQVESSFFSASVKMVPTVMSNFDYKIDDVHSRSEGYTGKKINRIQTSKNSQAHGWLLSYEDNYLKKLKQKIENQPGMEDAKEVNIGGYDLIERRLCYQNGLQVKAATCPSE